jgi:hypothetical protein
VRFGLAAGGAPAVVVVEVVPGDVGVTDGMSGVLVGRGVATVRSAAAASLGGLTSSAVVRSTIASTADMISGRSRTLPEPRFRLPAEGRGLPTEHLESLAGGPEPARVLGERGSGRPWVTNSRHLNVKSAKVLAFQPAARSGNGHHHRAEDHRRRHPSSPEP